MSRTSTLILLGILVILVPFSGLPIFIRTLLIVIFGACVAGIALSLRTADLNRSAPTAALPVESPSPEPTPSQGISPI